MNELVIMRDQHAVTTSLSVAEVFGKEHRNVLRDIRNLKKDALNFEQMFSEGDSPDSYGRSRKVYFMNRDGFSLLAMGFTGSEAVKFKQRFLTEYNRMEEHIKSQQQPIGNLELALRAALENTTQIKEIQTDVNMLKDSMRIDTNQEYKLKALVNKKAMRSLGGKDSFAYRKLSRKAFSEIWRDFKQHFHLARYGDLPRKEFDEGIEFISMWRPSTTLAMEIQAANRQGNLKLIEQE